MGADQIAGAVPPLPPVLELVVVELDVVVLVPPAPPVLDDDIVAAPPLPPVDVDDGLDEQAASADKRRKPAARMISAASRDR
jgi:hypothetical protein